MFISTQHIRKIMDSAETLAVEQAFTPRQRKMISLAFTGLKKKRKSYPAFIHFPLLVYAALRGNIEPALPLATATTLFFLGVDIFDDVADGDLPRSLWKGFHDSEINLIAATFFFSFPQLAISRMELSAKTIHQMQETLARGFLKMTAGQLADLSKAGSAETNVDDVEASVVAKSGEEYAMFALLSAQLAQTNERLMELCSSFGRACGVAAQLFSDCYDLFKAAHSRDLESGTRTLPIAFHLEALKGHARKDFLLLLDLARTDSDAQKTVRNELLATGELRKSAFVVESYCQQALRLLSEMEAMEPAAALLRQQIKNVSFFSRKRNV